MPETPDLELYIASLDERIVGHRFEALDVHSPLVLRSVEPSAAELAGHRVSAMQRVGKRIAIGLDGDYWIVIHLMIAGRLHWQGVAAKPRKAGRIARLVFSSGCLTLTEAGTRRRASITLLAGAAALETVDPGGLEPMSITKAQFVERLSRRNHTLKRALTDPRLLAGIGNAYSDEILHRARLSPVKQTKSLAAADWQALYDATRGVLAEWTERLARDAAGKWPAKVTAFHPGMSVHGRYRQPCPVCGTAVQRIRYKHNETNYCPRCQTGGKLLADRALSRLLKADWPKTIDELGG